MHDWKNKLVPILFAVGAALFLIPVTKEVIREEPVRVTFLVLADAFVALAVVFLAVGAARKSDVVAAQPPSA